ncbi:hypothetical protein ACLB2K_006481 [Fragaria x ananassa]
MLHAVIIKSGWSSSVEVKNSVLSFYAELGCLDDAVKVFESRYARNGHGEEAAVFFVEMMRTELEPDDFSFAAVLHACSNLALLGCGEMFHACIIHYGFHAYVFIGNGLVNMYAKCGDLKGSIRAFHEILHKDLVSWNAMLFAFGLHGKAIESLQVFEEMVVTGFKSDNVTFIGLLMACSHSGLIGESCALFESIQTIYGLSPEKDHVACMVDMLGRGGYLAEVKKLADKYCSVYSAKTSSCEALLGACSAHGDLGFGKHFGESLKITEPHNETSYVLLSNLYCASGQWKEAEMVRKRMADQGVKKMPGCNWIEVRNERWKEISMVSVLPISINLASAFSREQELMEPGTFEGQKMTTSPRLPSTSSTNCLLLAWLITIPQFAHVIIYVWLVPMCCNYLAAIQ